ncbi:MAG: DUF1624 domain-containing protein [Methanosarcinales archaeon]|nr:DUF1624 domain-containing protein [Methanosarcinales archaeon]
MNPQPGPGVYGVPGSTPANLPPARIRDPAIDVLRGLAIVSMVAAHLSPALEGPAPLWLRAGGSIAAPLFILISGMMVSLSSRERGRDLGRFLRRGGQVLLAAVLVDLMVWNIYPFLSFDVLYLIALAIPLTFLTLGQSARMRFALVLLIFLAAPFLQQHLGYADYPTEITLLGTRAVYPHSPTGIANHWLVDGWFPIFPWLGFSILGTVLADLRWRPRPEGDGLLTVGFNTVSFFLAGLCLAVAGSAALARSLGDLATRGGYVELFYPPTAAYLAASVGVCLLLFFLADLLPRQAAQRPLAVLVEHSLFMYVLHLALIRYLVYTLWPEESLGAFLLVFFGMVLLMVAAGERLGPWKRKLENRRSKRRYAHGR